MARRNKIRMVGWLMNDLQCSVDEEGNVKRITGMISVIRGQYSSTGKTQQLRIDTPFFRVETPGLIKHMKDWKRGDIIYIKGFFASKELQKGHNCPRCKHANMTRGVLSYVQPIYGMRLQEGVSEEDYFEVLKNYMEISNEVDVIGTLCREPRVGVTPNGLHITSYQLAIDRHFRVPEDGPTRRVDYPWVKSFGAQAIDDGLTLSTNSLVSIDGSLQVTEQIPRQYTCEFCETTYDWTDRAMEIVPRYGGVEYLRNVRTPEEVEKLREEDALDCEKLEHEEYYETGAPTLEQVNSNDEEED